MGEHPSDIIAIDESAADAFGWLEEIFRIIEESLAATEKGSFLPAIGRISNLAGIGRQVAFDFGETMIGRHMSMTKALVAAGIETHGLVGEVQHV